MTNPPSVPSLDVEACVRLLEELASADCEAVEQWRSMAFRCSDPTWCEERAKHFEERVTTLRALASALPGMGNDWIAPFHECPRCHASLNWTQGVDVFDEPMISAKCCGVSHGARLTWRTS